MVKNTIWSNYYDYIDSIVEDLMEDDYEKDIYMEGYGIDEEDFDESDFEDYCRERAYEYNEMYLEDERCNLNINVKNTIIAIADMGLWDGRRTAYKIIKSGNIADCLYSEEEYVDWYCDAHDFKATMTHHDGTNYVLYRMRKENITETEWSGFLYKIYTGKVKRADITRCTKSLQPIIAKVYGWKYREYPHTNYWDKQKFTGVGQTKHRKETA